jgi:hypothetical protein
VRLGLLRQREEVLGVASTDRVGLAARLEPLKRELADRLVHPEAIVRSTDEALLDEGLQRVEVGIGDALGRIKRAAAREDRQASEQVLLF